MPQFEKVLTRCISSDRQRNQLDAKRSYLNAVAPVYTARYKIADNVHYVRKKEDY